LVANTLGDGVLQKTEVLALKTGRADQADAMGRLLAVRNQYALSPDAEQMNGAATNLMQDIQRLYQLTSDDSLQLRPGCNIAIHGELLGISYQLPYFHRQREMMLDFSFTLLKLCVNVWNHVRAQLCVDSPETASEMDDELDLEGPKDLLAFSWRALRDSR
jgi:hypothetical protein